MRRMVSVLLVVTLLAPSVAFGQEGSLEEIRREYRSAKKAVFMSAPFPGWGQLYADSPFWAVIGFSAQMFYYGNLLMEMRRKERQRVARDRETDTETRDYRSTLVVEHGERARDFVWWSMGTLLILSLDAYVSVQLADFDSPDPPTPDLDREWPENDDGGGGVSLGLSFAF